jgi:hypothetical protein
VVDPLRSHQVAHGGGVPGRDHLLEDPADQRLVGGLDNGRARPVANSRRIACSMSASCGSRPWSPCRTSTRSGTAAGRACRSRPARQR